MWACSCEINVMSSSYKFGEYCILFAPSLTQGKEIVVMRDGVVVPKCYC